MGAAFGIFVAIVLFGAMFLYYGGRFLGVFLESNTSCGGCALNIIIVGAIIFGLIYCCFGH